MPSLNIAAPTLHELMKTVKAQPLRLGTATIYVWGSTLQTLELLFVMVPHLMLKTTSRSQVVLDMMGSIVMQLFTDILGIRLVMLVMT